MDDVLECAGEPEPAGERLVFAVFVGQLAGDRLG